MNLLGGKKTFKMTTSSDSWSTDNSEYAELDFLPTVLEILQKVKKFEVSNFL